MSYKEGKALAEAVNSRYYEVSAKKNHNIRKLFEETAGQVLSLKRPASSSVVDSQLLASNTCSLN